jgi:diketogulonate reductase-like aldo/keto reductase
MEFKELGRSGQKVPVLGLGTWGIGGFSTRYLGRGDEKEVQALRLGLELGMRFIDTAEMYASGHSEEVVGKAAKSQREEVFIATKVSPEHLHHDDVIRSCESSLRRLETNYVDLYQVHWPNPKVPIAQTMKAMEQLVTEGKIRHIGVSNFSLRQTKEAQEALSKNTLAANQVEYSLLDRSIEPDLLSYSKNAHITIIAYSPLARGQIARGRSGQHWQILDEVASKYGKTRSQIALNWLIAKESVVAIPKAASLDHLRENVEAVGWRMGNEDYNRLSEAFR